jgi:fumarate reductase subunit C
VRAGLGGAEVLGRTRGSVGIAVFYGLFVIAASIHGAIGLRAIGIEWLRLRPEVSGMFAFVLALALMALGMRAVFAVVAA